MSEERKLITITEERLEEVVIKVLQFFEKEFAGEFNQHDLALILAKVIRVVAVNQRVQKVSVDPLEQMMRAMLYGMGKP
jgi:hypothetical protein